MFWSTWDLNLKVRLIGETIFHTFYWMFFPFMALYFSDAFGKDLTGILLMFPPLLGILASLYGGQLSDRVGRRPAMLIGAATECLMFALFALSWSPWVDYAAFIGLNIASSIYWPASSAMVADLTREEDRREVYATFYTAMNIGVVLGPVLGSFFFFQHRPQLLLVCFLVSFAFTLTLYLVIKETLPNKGRSKHKAHGLKEQWRSYTVIFRDKVFALYILAGILVAVTFLQMDLYMGVYLKEYVPLQNLISWGDGSISVGGTQAFGWMMSLNGLMVVLFTLAVTRLCAAWSDRRSLIVSSVLSGLGLFAMSLTVNVWLLFACMVLFTIGELIRTPVTQSFVSKYAPEDRRGQYMGASTLQFSIGRFIAPLTIALSEWFAPIGVFGIILMFALVAALLYHRMFILLPAAMLKDTGAAQQQDSAQRQEDII
ncbi:MDR family MFS transporter [Brevibacillus massiliensis]|uniref:MDR family MFS transporter n=1 Tax=Brevibacillus massiliensis TaxID=1118054 RepID=UPI0002E12C22|nr:MFS transporter [Brevibacillus massiliensis]